MKKKILIFSLVFCFVFLTIGVFSSKKVLADDATIEMVPGAAIRTSETNPGIRFAANITGDFGDGATFGFLLVKGKYTKDEILRNYQDNPCWITPLTESDDIPVTLSSTTFCFFSSANSGSSVLTSGLFRNPAISRAVFGFWVNETVIFRAFAFPSYSPITRPFSPTS